MASKLSLTPAPTFRYPVDVPTPSGPRRVNFEFKHRTRDALAEFGASLIERERQVEEILGEVLVGWDLADEFNPDNITRLCAAYPAAGGAILDTYLERSLGRAAVRE